MYVDQDRTSIDYDEIISSDCEELTFADPNGWVLTYDLRQLDYMMEYSQSTGRGEICGICDKIVGKGEVAMNFTTNGKKNKKLLSAYVNEQPHIRYGQAKRYVSLVKK